MLSSPGLPLLSNPITQKSQGRLKNVKVNTFSVSVSFFFTKMFYILLTSNNEIFGSRTKTLAFSKHFVNAMHALFNIIFLLFFVIAEHLWWVFPKFMYLSTYLRIYLSVSFSIHSFIHPLIYF